MTQPEKFPADRRGGKKDIVALPMTGGGGGGGEVMEVGERPHLFQPNTPIRPTNTVTKLLNHGARYSGVDTLLSKVCNVC